MGRTTSTMSGYKPRRPAPPPPNMPSHSQLKTYFDRVDSNKSGSITPQELQSALVNGNNTELQAALTTFGYNLSPPVYTLLIRKFDRTKSQAVRFDDFIQCCLVLHGITDMFREEDTDLDGVVTISYEKFLTM